MPTHIEINPVFKELLEIAWGGSFGNIRIISPKSAPALSWHTELDSILMPEGANVFWSTTAFAKPLEEAKKADMSHCGILWVDIDEPAQMTEIVVEDGDEHEIPRIFTPQPNFIIHTSPGKAHLFYVIDPVPTQDLNLLEAIQVALSKHLGGDKASRDLGHISRVPGSVNPKNGHKVSIEKLHSKVYSVSELNPEALGPGEGRHQHTMEALARAAARGDNIEEEMQRIEAVDLTAPFDPNEREGLVDWAESSDVKKLAPAPVDGETVERWVHESKPKIIDYSNALGNHDIRENAMGGRLMMNGTLMDDGMFSVLYRHVEARGYPVEIKLRHAIQSNARLEEPFNPVITWIEKKEWDGSDHIAHLAEFFDDGDTEDFEVFLRHWLVGSVAKHEEAMGAFNRMLVLEGAQGIGKSHFAEWLCPPALREYWSQDILNTDDKDAFIKATETWIWEIQELEGVKNVKDQAALKAFLSSKKVSVRKPFARFPMNETVRASYIGTLNDIGGFLQDTTGNRRYMAVSLNYIDWDYVTKVDLRQLWAQALYLYRDGFNWELKGDAERRASEANESFMTESVLAELVKSMFNIDAEELDKTMTTAEVIKVVSPQTAKDPTIQQMGAVLQHLGARRVRRTVNGKRARLWVGVSPKEGLRV